MLDQKEEAKFDELKGMFRDLKLPPPLRYLLDCKFTKMENSSLMISREDIVGQGTFTITNV